MEVKKPSLLFRTGVVITQVGYVALFSVAYFVAPRVCHRLVGYLEEEAVKTYSKCIKHIMEENGPISHWKTTPAPEIAKYYWNLDEKSTLLDVVYAVRKDEEHHKIVNHVFGDDYTQKSKNQFPPGY